MKEFDDFLQVVRRLRKECPWDRERTLQDMGEYLVEEAYEFLSAVREGKVEGVEEELGDVLLIFLMASVILEERGRKIEDIIRKVKEKMIQRHPHVFGEDVARTGEEVLKKWEDRKKKGFYVERSLPALLRSWKLQEKAKRKGFDWESVDGVYDKIKEEVEELRHAQEDLREEELGDLLFVVSHLGNFFKINPEVALHRACDKFQERFRRLEEEVKRMGKKIEEMTLQELDKIWERIKEEK
ncbi:nucleoside triphosphate pyrophosphohydrolase [bacterium]|nr:MAG: nucleoside triphosphate pyrophosphohydrolase [bacterium]